MRRGSVTDKQNDRQRRRRLNRQTERRTENEERKLTNRKIGMMMD